MEVVLLIISGWLVSGLSIGLLLCRLIPDGTPHKRPTITAHLETRQRGYTRIGTIEDDTWTASNDSAGQSN